MHARGKHEVRTGYLRDKSEISTITHIIAHKDLFSTDPVVTITVIINVLQIIISKGYMIIKILY